MGSVYDGRVTLFYRDETGGTWRTSGALAKYGIRSGVAGWRDIRCDDCQTGFAQALPSADPKLDWSCTMLCWKTNRVRYRCAECEALPKKNK